MPHILTCQTCGKSFEERHMQRFPKFCSKECHYVSKRAVATCATCGGEFTCPKSTLSQYCSNACFVKSLEKPKVERICVVCGKREMVRPSEARYKTCSRECGYKYQSDQGEKKNCVVCGKVFKPRGGAQCCSRKCKGVNHAKLIEGSKNGRWNGGKSKEPYPIVFNNRLKNEIRARDNYTCKLCGVHENSLNQRLSIHHIDYNKNNCSSDNLTALCRSCNSRVNSHRSRWTQYFTEQLSTH